MGWLCPRGYLRPQWALGAAGAEGFPPCSCRHPAQAGRKQDPGEGSVLWTALVNINRRPGRAGGTGGREEAVLGPFHGKTLPHSSFWGCPVSGLAVFTLLKLRGGRAQSGLLHGTWQRAVFSTRPIYSAFSPAPCYRCLAQAAPAPISFHSPAVQQAAWHQRPSWQALPHCKTLNASQQVIKNKSLGATQRQGSQLQR